MNPSGKLPFSFPAKLTDCGAHAFDELSYPGDSIKQEYKEDILVAIVGTTPRRFRTLPLRSWLELYYLYIWQTGASAKTMAADGTLTVTVAVKNTGSIAGKEIRTALCKAMINAVCFVLIKELNICKSRFGAGRGRRA